MGKFIDYIVFVVVSTILVPFIYLPIELQETIYVLKPLELNSIFY